MTAASDTIRASINALPEYARADVVIRTQPARWERDAAGNVHVAKHRRSSTTARGFLAEAESNEIAAHIALLASPDVATALADLLDAIRVAVIDDDGTVAECIEALENAILRRPT